MTDPIADRLDRRLLAGILLLALVVRCGVVAWRFDQLTLDRDAYLGIAENLVAGQGFSLPGATLPTAYRPPLYPVMLAAALSCLPAVLAVALLNVAAGLITVWLVDRLGALLKLGPARHLASGLVAIDPLLLNATPQPMTEVIFTALVTAWLWAVARNMSCPMPIRALLAGIFFGLAALCRPTIWPIAGLLAVAWAMKFWLVPKDNRQIQSALLTSLAALLVVSPWVIRNQLIFGRPILMTTHGGYTLLLANNPILDQEVVQQPWGAVWQGDSLARWQADVEQRLQASPGADQNELTRDAWMSAAARQYIQARPDRFLAATLHRLRCLWSVSPHGEGTSLPFAIRAGVAVFYLLEYLGAMIGFILIIRRRQSTQWLPCFLLIVTIQAVHLVYWTDARMRTPLVPVLALLTAAAFVPACRTAPADR